MKRTFESIESLVVAAWFGGGLFLLAVAAPAAFDQAPTRTIAGNVVGQMLGRWHYVALAVPLVLLVALWKRGRLGEGSRALLLSAALILAAGQSMVDLRIRAIRASMTTAVDQLPPGDPERRRFGMLHGVSSLLFAMQVAAAGAVVAIRRGEDDRSSS